jgi:hypothetical protein
VLSAGYELTGRLLPPLSAVKRHGHPGTSQPARHLMTIGSPGWHNPHQRPSATQRNSQLRAQLLAWQNPDLLVASKAIPCWPQLPAWTSPQARHRFTDRDCPSICPSEAREPIGSEFEFIRSTWGGAMGVWVHV